MLFEIETDINRDILIVYEFLTNLDKLPWHTHPVVKEYLKLTDAQFNIGTKYKEIVVYRKMKFEIDSVVTRNNKPTEIEYKWKGKNMRGILIYNFRESNNKTLLRQTQTLQLDWFLKIMNSLFYIMFQKQITKRLQSIKFILDNKMEKIKSFMELNFDCTQQHPDRKDFQSGQESKHVEC
jgi:hypothetical protein